MRVLHVLAQLPSRTGSGVYFSNIIDGLKKLGHEQKAIFACQDENTWSILDQKDQYPVVFKTKKMPFPIVGMSDVMPYENTIYSEMTEGMMDIWKSNFVEILEKIKREFNPDIIFAHHLWILTSLVVEIFSDARIIGICHNTDLRQARMNPLLKTMHVGNIEKLDMIFSTSEMQKNEIAELYNYDVEKIISMGGGFNQNIFYPPDKKEYSDIVRLIYCAKIDPSKGIYELVEAYKSLELKDVSLDIIGSPDEENSKRLKALINGDDTISLYNVKNQEDLAETLRNKDIFLMPSYYEGLGLMAIESLACGLYVVTTEIEALMAFLGDEINNSKIIEYVPLPRIYDTDKPVSEDIPSFKEDLKTKILEQIEKVRKKESIPPSITNKVKELSWDRLIDRINIIMNIKK